MELNLSYLLEKKEIDIRLGDHVFTGVISASVIDIVQNQSRRQIKKLLKAKKFNLSTLGAEYNDKQFNELGNEQLFKLFEKMNIDLSDLVDTDVEIYHEVVKAFFGAETYAAYAALVDSIGLALSNKQIYEMIVEQIQNDTKDRGTEEKNE